MTKQTVRLHLGIYQGVHVGIYEYCPGFFSPPFVGCDSAFLELKDRQCNTAIKISDEEFIFLEKMTEKNLPSKRNANQKETEKQLRIQYAEDPSAVLRDIFNITVVQHNNPPSPKN